MKFKVRLLAIFLIGLFSIQPTISLSDDSLETVQLTLVITAADEINLTAVKQVEKGINSFEAISELVAMKAKETDMGTYEELTISPKMITEFVSFAQKTKLIDEPKNIKANYWDEKKQRIILFVKNLFAILFFLKSSFWRLYFILFNIKFTQS